jgi:hypothetical protein
MRIFILILWLFYSLFLPNSGHSAENSEEKKSEELKSDFRFLASVGQSFNSKGKFNGHLLTKGEFSYGVWLTSWFRLGGYIAPFWLDMNSGSTHSIEGGLDMCLLFFNEESWGLGLEVNEGILYSDKDFPRSNTYRFNFNSSVGPVFRYKMGEDYSFDIGYRFSHFSNAGLKKANVTSFNPGINYHSGVIGVSYYFR